MDQLLVTPRGVAQHEGCKHEVLALARLHDFDPHDKEAVQLGHHRRGRGLPTMTDGMKYFLGAVGVTTLFLGGLT